MKEKKKEELYDDLDKFELLYTAYNVPDKELTKDAIQLKNRIFDIISELYGKMVDKPIRLQIQGYDDRRKVASILADNDFKVRIKKDKEYCYSDEKYFVEVWLK